MANSRAANANWDHPKSIRTARGPDYIVQLTLGPETFEARTRRRRPPSFTCPEVQCLKLNRRALPSRLSWRWRI